MLKLQSLTQECLITVGVVLTALLLMLGLDPWLGMIQTPFLLFFGAVPIVALYTGQRGGIIATVLCALLANYFFIPPIHSLSMDVTGIGRSVIFLLEGTLISILIGALRRAQDQTKASLRQLKASEAKFRRLADSNVIGIVSASIYGAITDANDAFLNSMGYTREDVLSGRVRWDEMTPADFKHLDVPAYEELITKGKNTPYEKILVGKQGQRVSVVVGTALLEDDPEQMISFILNVSERKRAEQRLAVQYAVARALAEATTVNDAISQVLEALGEGLGWQLGLFWRVDFQTNTLNYFDGWHSPALDMSSLLREKQKITFAPGVGLPGRIWESGQSDWIADLAQATNFPRRTIALESGLRSVFGFPVAIDQEISGVIECFSDQYQEPDDDLLQTVTAIGSQLGQFIERKQTEEKLQASQALFQSFMNYSPINAYIKDEAGHYLYVNSCMEQAFNRPLAEWVGKTDFDLFSADIAKPIRDNDLAVLQAGQPAQIAETNPLADGKHYYLSFKFPIRDATEHLLLAGMSVDISDRKRFEVEREQLLQQLEASLGQLEAVINSMTEGLLIANAQGNVIRFNPAALKLHGYKSMEEVQQHLHQFQTLFEARDLQGNVLSVEEWALAKALRGETFSNWEIQVTRLDTGKTWIGSYSGTPVRNKQGELMLAIVTTHDVTKQRQTQAEIARSLASEKAARAEAESANRIKDEFLAVLSHELRSPLNPILGWAKLLQSGTLSEETSRQALETIERNAKLQTQLIDDLLDVSRILRGKMGLNITPVNLETVIESAIETMRLAAEAKQIQIQTTITLTNGHVFGDPTRLQQIVWNLLSNAVKFTPNGGQVNVILEQVDEEGQTVFSSSNAPPTSPTYAQIRVSDTGKGIIPDFLPYVFDYFRQEDSKTTRKFGGLGLGLAIVRHLVELHGGTAQAESAGEGLGATFTVRLPLMTAQTAANATAHPLKPVLNLNGIQILFVDDDADTREFVSFVLENAGATVITVSTAREALACLTQSTPHLLLSDVGMPDMDGYMLMRQVRALPPEHGGKIPAIALTAFAGETNEQQALTAGFQMHLSKPIEPDHLISMIASLIVR